MESVFGATLLTVGRFSPYKKKIIRFMADAHLGTSLRGLFKELEILPVPCSYVHFLVNFIINNQEVLQTN